MKKNAIVIFTRSLPFHALGGMEIVAWDLAITFSRLDHEVVIVTTSLEGREEVEIISGIKVIFLTGVKSAKYSKEWWVRSLEYFKDNLEKNTSTIFSVSVAGIEIAKNRMDYPHVKCIMQAHGTSWGEIKSKWRTGKIKNILTSVRNFSWLIKDLLNYRRFDHIIAVGDQVREDLTSFPTYLTLDDKKIKVINNGVDTRVFTPLCEGTKNIFSELNIPPDAKVILSASRLHPQKGLIRCLNAFKKVTERKNNCYYLIAGDGPQFSVLEKKVKELDLEGKVIFLGRLKRESLADYLRASSVFLFLTEHVEVGITLSILEALATGAPVVVSEHLRLFDSPHINKVSIHDEKKIASLILDVLEMSPIQKESLLPDKFSLESVGAKYLELIIK